MYWCFNCEREFEELDIYTDFIGVEPYGVLVRFYKCPICGSELDTGFNCPNCGYKRYEQQESNKTTAKLAVH